VLKLKRVRIIIEAACHVAYSSFLALWCCYGATSRIPWCHSVHCCLQVHTRRKCSSSLV